MLDEGKGSFTINVRVDIFFGGVGLEILKKRPDINYLSKSSEKLRVDIFSGGGVTRLSRAMTNCLVKP